MSSRPVRRKDSLENYVINKVMREDKTKVKTLKYLLTAKAELENKSKENQNGSKT